MKRYMFLAVILFSSIIACQNSVEKSIVVVIPSFNNKDWYVKNLDSIFSQRYTNFRVIYIDDCSEDGTSDLVEEYIIKNKYHHKCTIIKNKNRYGPLYNRYNAIHSCSDDDIVVLVDGDDWLAHDGVLAYLNEVYTNEPIYMTVGNASKSSTGKKIGHRDYTQDEWNIFGIRQLGFRGVHPRTFYAWLFKKIKLEDLFEGESLYPMATDVACLLPMFEMAQGHYKFIMDILYVYNDQNPLNMARTGFQTQIYCDMMIRNRPSYSQLRLEDVGSATAHKTLDLGCIAFVGNQQDAYPLVDHCKEEGVIFNSLVAIGSQELKLEAFAPIAQSLQFLNLGCDLQTIYSFRVNIRDRVKAFIEKMDSNYIVIATDELLNNKTIDFESLCAALENTHAYSMVLGRNPSSAVESYYTYSKDEICKVSIARPWLFSESFNSKEGCIGLIVRKDILLTMIESMTVFYPNFYTFLAAWNSLVPMSSVLLMSFFNN